MQGKNNKKTILEITFSHVLLLFYFGQMVFYWDILS